MSTIAEKVLDDELDAAWALLPDAQPGDRLSEAIANALAKAYADGREAVRAGFAAVLCGDYHRDVVALVARMAEFLERQSLAPVVGAEGGENARTDDLPVGQETEPGPGGDMSDGPARASIEEEQS